jgi:hypothetical protein
MDQIDYESRSIKIEQLKQDLTISTREWQWKQVEPFPLQECLTELTLAAKLLEMARFDPKVQDTQALFEILDEVYEEALRTLLAYRAAVDVAEASRNRAFQMERTGEFSANSLRAIQKLRLRPIVKVNEPELEKYLITYGYILAHGVDRDECRVVAHFCKSHNYWLK